MALAALVCASALVPIPTALFWAVWDQLANGTWVSDYYINTPGVGVFTPGVGQCGQVAPPPAATREQKAVNWARSNLGATGWNRWCDKFDALAYGQSHSGYYTAFLHWRAMVARGLAHPGDPNVPLGGLAFYANGYNGGAGHVMISEGNGQFVSTGPHVFETGLTPYFGTYLGWSYAQPEWAGL
jgi:hypothetical protein